MSMMSALSINFINAWVVWINKEVRINIKGQGAKVKRKWPALRINEGKIFFKNKIGYHKNGSNSECQDTCGQN